MKRLKIRVTALIIIALILGLGGLSFLNYFKTRQLLTTNLEQSIGSLTISSGSEVGLWLNARKAEMELMANMPLIQSGDRDTIIAYMNAETQRNTIYEQFFVADDQGNYYLNSGKTGSVADRDYFQKVVSTGNTVISDPLISRGSGNQIVVVAAPIKMDGKVTGLIGGNVSLNELSQIATSAKVGKIGYAFLLQEDGLIIAHPEKDLIMKFNVLEDSTTPPDMKEAARKMIDRESGVTRYFFLGEEKYMAYAPVPGIKWALGVTVPVTYVTDQLRPLPVYFIAVTFFFGIILAFLLSRWLVGPLSKLAEITTGLSGKLHDQTEINWLKSPVVEVDSLTSNFRHMAATLQKSFQELINANAALEAENAERVRAEENLTKSYEELGVTYEELGATEEELRRNYEELQSKEEALRESEELFRTMSNSSPIGIYIIQDGKFQFANTRFQKYIGYSKDELLGMNPMQIVLPEDRNKVRDCAVGMLKGNCLLPYEYRAVSKNGEITWVMETVASIQYKGKRATLGNYMDITERKLMEEKLKHLGLHDPLTGLYNRAYFEEEMRRFEGDRFAPVGIVVCDVDGLKLVNDTLGHGKGDEMLRLTASIIRQCFRKKDAISRIGGDEFAVVLPKSGLLVVEHACRRVQDAVTKYNSESPEFPLSLSIGFAISGNTYANMSDIFKEADNNMYREKLYRSQSTRSAIVQTLMKALEARDFITEGHAERLQDLVAAMGEAIGMSDRNLVDLRLLAQFHDIGKVGVPDRILFKPGPLTTEEFVEMQRHSEIGHRIAQSAPDLVPISDQILKHHEWWNGEGYPLGLKGEEIPLECRILAIADAYDAMTSDRPYRKAMTHVEALIQLTSRAGTQFDPQLVPEFLRILENRKHDCSTLRA